VLHVCGEAEERYRPSGEKEQSMTVLRPDSSIIGENSVGAWAGTAGGALRRWLLVPALAAAVLVGGYEACVALEPSGAAIRHDLARAGAEVASLSWSTPKDRVEQAVARRFPGYVVTVEAAGFPVSVTVTLHDLDRAACRDAYRIADRIDGEVVIAMERPDPPCQDSTSLAWRIMP
jgi:hypothetical protein